MSNEINQDLVWTIPNTQGDISIYIPGKRKIVYKISGGADSAILLYMLAKYRQEFNPELDFVFATSVNVNLPYQEIFAKQVIEYVNNKYPLGNFEHYVNSNRGGKFYTVDQDALTDTLRPDDKSTVQWMGITCNPIKQEQDAFADNMWEYRVPERDPGHPENHPVQEMEISPGVFKFNRPFMKHNKRGVAELYTTFGVLDELFPLTRSCEDDTHDFSHHCGECWFCQEREWGYGVLDPLLEGKK